MLKIPKYISRFYLKIGVFILLFSICRLVFLLLNNHLFPVVYFTDFLAGIWFDFVTTAIIFLPLVLVELFPNKWRGNRYYQFFLLVLANVFLFFSLLMNIADIEYFKHSSTRSTGSTIKMLTYGSDLKNQMGSFWGDYWYLFLIQFLLSFIAFYLFKKIHKKFKDDSKETSWLKQSLFFLLSAGLLVLAGRGTGLRPIAPITITGYTIDQNVPLVLNSTFNIIKTWGNIELKEKDYFEEEELVKIFNPIQQATPQNDFQNTNIVVILLESFSVEYISVINGSNESYTPFLDSLIKESLVFTHCYANGKKSIDAVPSVISSIPKLMDEEFITSAYSTNQIESLPNQLKRLNYHSSFFHGASNGSMNFDQFCKKVGFDEYYGRKEYNNEKDYDGTWGIFDEEFLIWTSQKLSEIPKPFFSTIFTLSSHPPYTIPDKYKGKFKGPTKMHKSVGYTDYALSSFFKSAKNTDWYNNTVFIITADHTPSSTQPEYIKEIGNMHIPLIIFHPNDTLLRGESKKVVSQVDIMPTVLELTHYPYSFYSFGSSVFSTEEGFSFSKIGDKYFIFGREYLLVFQNEESTDLHLLEDKLQSLNYLTKYPEQTAFLERKLKAIIQTYNRDLINNQMIVK